MAAAAAPRAAEWRRLARGGGPGPGPLLPLLPLRPAFLPSTRVLSAASPQHPSSPLSSFSFSLALLPALWPSPPLVSTPARASRLPAVAPSTLATPLSPPRPFLRSPARAEYPHPPAHDKPSVQAAQAAGPSLPYLEPPQPSLPRRPGRSSVWKDLRSFSILGGERSYNSVLPACGWVPLISPLSNHERLET